MKKQPKTTVEFLNAIKDKHGIQSNYALARKLGQTDTSIARWAHGKGSFSDETCLHVADLLEIDPAYVVACIHAERAKHEAERNVWERIAKHYAHPSLFMLTLAVTFTYVRYDPPAPDLLDFVAAHAPSPGNTVYYVK